MGGFLEVIAKTFELAAFDVLMGPCILLGRSPAYPPLTIFKISFSSDGTGFPTPGAEEDVTISCRPFLDLRSRQHIKYSLSEKLLAEVNHELDARGLIVEVRHAG